MMAWWSVVRHPWRFFSDVQRVAEFRRPVWFYLICTTASAVAEHVYYDDRAGSGVVSGLLVGVLRAVPGLYLLAGVLHLAARVVGGSAALGVTLRACALASAPALFALVPWVGLLGELWALVLLVFALARVHSLSILHGVASLCLPIVLLVGAALGVRTFVVEAFGIPGASMAPTLMVGDHIFVEKYAYARGELPARGDVVVFEYPYAEPDEPGQDFVKRLVGLPGDELVFQQGLLSINGERAPSCRVGRARLPQGDTVAEVDIYVEWLGERAYLVALGNDEIHGVEGPYVVPEGEVWMAGDNRNSSLDSRFWVRSGSAELGAGVPLSYIKGRASRVWMPAPRFWTPVNAEPTLPRELSELEAQLRACQAP